MYWSYYVAEGCDDRALPGPAHVLLADDSKVWSKVLGASVKW